MSRRDSSGRVDRIKALRWLYWGSLASVAGIGFWYGMGMADRRRADIEVSLGLALMVINAAAFACLTSPRSSRRRLLLLYWGSILALAVTGVVYSGLMEVWSRGNFFADNSRLIPFAGFPLALLAVLTALFLGALLRVVIMDFQKWG